MVCERMSQLKSADGATWESKLGDVLKFAMEGLAQMGILAKMGVSTDRGEWPNPSWEMVDEGFESFVVQHMRCLLTSSSGALTLHAHTS